MTQPDRFAKRKPVMVSLQSVVRLVQRQDIISIYNYRYIDNLLTALAKLKKGTP